MGDSEGRFCWQCSDYLNVFPEFMASIKKLKIKKQKTNEDNILQELLSKGNTDIKDDTTKIFDYAVEIAYIIKSKYKDHDTYRINLTMSENINCKSCGENIVPFNCNDYEVDPDIRLC